MMSAKLFKVYLICLNIGNQFSVVQDGHLFTALQRRADIICSYYNGAAFVSELLQYCDQIFAGCGVEGGKGFVCKQDGGAVQQSPCNGQALYHSTRQGGGAIVAAGCQAGFVQQFFDSCIAFFETIQPCKKAEVFLDRQLWVDHSFVRYKTQHCLCVLISTFAEATADKLAVKVEACDFHGAVVGRYKAGDYPDECSFSGGVCAEDAEGLAAEQLKAYVIKHGSIGEGFAYAGDVEGQRLSGIFLRFFSHQLRAGFILIKFCLIF
jgi:hypothetical protein